MRHASLPFDWVLSEFRPIYNLFSQDFKNFLTSKDKLTSKGVHAVNEYGIEFRHHLKNHETYDDFDEVKNKYDRRCQRLLDIMHSNKRVLFIRRGGMSENQALELDTLWQDKFSVDYHIAVVDKRPISWSLPRFTTAFVPEGTDWRGDDESWDQFFQAIKKATTK